MFNSKVSRALMMVAVIMSCGAVVAHASMTSTSYMFNVSNTYPTVQDYGTVTIEADDSTGMVKFIVDAKDVQPLYGNLNNFGIQKFGFNVTDNSILSSISSMTLPSGWSLKIQPNNSLSMFGVFEATTAGNGNSRQDPLEFALTLGDASKAVASNFAATSSNGFLFAAHVAGYQNGPGSHWIAAIGGPISNPQVPAPGALALGIVGLFSLGLTKRRTLA